MWIVKPNLYLDGSSPRAAVIHLDTILQGAYLIGVYGKEFLPKELSFTDSLNVAIFIILGRPPLTHLPYPLYSPDLIIQPTPSSRDLILSIHDIIHDIMTHQA
jgi:hypothetical protein